MILWHSLLKIDKNKKPQYPIDEAYYLNKAISGILDMSISCYSISHKKDEFIYSPLMSLYFLSTAYGKQRSIKFI
jgi:hypothetical protein